MRFKVALPPVMRIVRNSSRLGFTLAEALAALAFLAIVVPVAVEGVRLANQAGQVAERKQEAGRVASRVLGEMVATKQWQQVVSSGTAQEGRRQYRWEMRSRTWEQGALQLLSVDVTYEVQGRECAVRLSTLADTSQ